MSQAATTAYELQINGIPRDLLRVVSFEGVEEISALYRFDVRVQFDGDPLLLKTLAPGCSATLVLHAPGEPPRLVNGLVRRLTEQGPEHLDPHVHQFTLCLVPHLWRLTRRINSRIFQDLSVVEIVTRVLSEAGIAHRWMLSARHRTHEYCVQYEESDYRFITRILSGEGIYFFFEPAWEVLSHLTDSPLHAATAHSAGDERVEEQVVLADSAYGYLPIPALASAIGDLVRAGTGRGSGALNVNLSPPVYYREWQETLGDEDAAVTRFELSRALKATSVVLRDYDFTRPLADLAARASVSAAADPIGDLNVTALALSAKRVQEQLELAARVSPERFEVYDHHGEFEEPDAFAADSALILQALRAGALVGRGESLTRRMSPGFRFALTEHPDTWLDREYAVLRVRHRLLPAADRPVGEVRRDGETLRMYRNEFECVPATVTLRPRRRPRRLQQVLEVAHVVGPPGEEIYTDTYGRVKVRFPWDRENTRDETRSCWLRVAQAWAGSTWGSQFVPRVGMEVLVSFVGGDVDRPLVIGTAYNGINHAPFELPAHKSRSGIRTHSTPGGGGHNELSFEDARGAERVDLRAERTLAAEVGRTHELRVGLKTTLNPSAEGYMVEAVATDRSEHVGRDRRARIDRDHVVHVGHDARMHVERGHSLSVGGSSETRVAGDESREVRGDVRRDAGGSLSEDVRGAHTTSVGDDSALTIGGDQHVLVRRNQRTTVGGIDHRVVAGDAATSVGASFALSAGRSVWIEGLDAVRLSCGASSIELTASGVVIEGPDVVVRATGGVSVQAPDVSLALRDGAADVEARQTVSVVADKAVTLAAGSVSLTLDADGKSLDAGGDSVTLAAKSASLDLRSDAVLIGSKVKLNPAGTPTSSTSAQASPEELKTSWVDLRLVDDAGAAIPGARFIVRMSNNEEVTGVLNGDGFARVRVVPGATKVTFPDLDASAWK